VDVVIFDCGGVLTDPARILAEWRGYERQLGLPVDSIRQALTSGELWEAVSTGEIGEAEYWQRAAASLAPRLPPAFTRFEHTSLPFEELNPQAVGIAAALRGQVRLGILSNATVSLRPALERMAALRALFDDIVISAEVGLRKPDPRIYALAASRLAVELGRAVLVDDKERNTAAAQQIGMPAILYISPAQLREELSRLGLKVEAC